MVDFLLCCLPLYAFVLREHLPHALVQRVVGARAIAVEDVKEAIV